MTSCSLPPLGWETAAGGIPVNATSLDLGTLGEHLGCCLSTNAPLLALHHISRAVHGFVTTRLVTTLVLVALMAALTGLIF